MDGQDDNAATLAFTHEICAADNEMLLWLGDAQDAQLSLCNDLEEIADSLPDHVDTMKCRHMATALLPMIHRLHHFEETVLFPRVERRSRSIAQKEMLDRLRCEHLEDQGYGEELTETLLRLANRQPVNIEAAGYMLRGFFAGLRRHIAFERTHILRNFPAAGMPPQTLDGGCD